MGSIEKTQVPFEGDSVMPLHAFDDTALNRIMAVTGLFRYNAVLDANLLRDSLTQLLHIGDWKKLRGRLRLTDADKLEVHVPPQATRKRPAIRFRQTVFGQPINSHPLINKLAQPQRVSAVQPAIANFDGISSVIIPPEWPRSLDEYVDSERDEPILGLHVLSFTDATIVVLAFCHVMMDGGGLESLLKAWSDVMYGNAAAVEPMGGASADPLDAVRATYSSRSDKFVLADDKIDLASLMPEDGAAPPTDPDWDTSSPESRWRTLSLSPAALSKLRGEAADSSPPQPTFFSEDDVVTAWIIRSVAGMLPATRPVNMMRLYDLRKRLPAAFKPDTAYIQNAYQMAWNLFPSAGALASAPLGEVAAKLREALAAQTAEGQAVAAMAAREGGNTPLFGSPMGAFFTLNSWVRMKLYERADFAPAVLESHDSLAVKPVPAGQPEFIDFDFALGGAPPGPNVISSGKDATGTRHAMAFLSNVMWPKMEDAVAKLG